MYLVASFKRMMVGTLTTSMWLQRSTLWNLVALQATDGGWHPNDAIAGAVRAAGEPVLTRNPNGGADSKPIIKSYFSSDALLRCMPRSLQACAANHGWSVVDRVWCTLLAVKAYEELGHKWVINPWDDEYYEYDMLVKAWSFLDMTAKDDPELAAAIIDSQAEAGINIENWRIDFTAKIERFKYDQEAAAAQRARDTSTASRLGRFVHAIPTYTVSEALVGIARSTETSYKYTVKNTKWVIVRYMKAHMFWRAFTATATDAFSASERIAMQATIYFLALVTTIWFFYERAEACCLQLRADVGCSSNILEPCKNIEGGCRQLMSEEWIKPADWECGAFPDTERNTWHLVWLIVINVLIMFPVKLVLVRIFTAGGGVLLEPHWREALIQAGLSYIEVYVAWMEVIFQIITNPIEAIRSPEFGRIVMMSKGALTMMGMVCCVSASGFVFVTIPATISARFYPQEPKTLLYPSEKSVMRRLEVVAAADAPEGVKKGYATPLFTALEKSRANGNNKQAIPLAVQDTDRAADALAQGGRSRRSLGGVGDIAGGVSKSLADIGRDIAARTERVNVALASGMTELRRHLRRVSSRTKKIGSNLVAGLDMIGLLAWRRRLARSNFFWGFIVKNLGWFITAVVWIVGTWIVLAYGVLIYTYLGEGEERKFMTAWGVTFLINTFGLESMAVIARKAVFIWFVEKMHRFMKYRTVVEWYEGFIEKSGSANELGDEDDVEDDEADGTVDDM